MKIQTLIALTIFLGLSFNAFAESDKETDPVQHVKKESADEDKDVKAKNDKEAQEALDRVKKLTEKSREDKSKKKGK